VGNFFLRLKIVWVIVCIDTWFFSRLFLFSFVGTLLVFEQIIPSLSNGQDAVNFRQMKESNSLHLEEQTAAGRGLYHSTSRTTRYADDGLDSDVDLFGAFSSVTLHYDGET
jgi:hypothetical protein